LKCVQIIEECEHILGWFPDSKQGFEAGKNQGGKLLGSDDGRNREDVGQDIGKKMNVFHLGGSEVRFHAKKLNPYLFDERRKNLPYTKSFGEATEDTG
jgi:hypothetical protein